MYIKQDLRDNAIKLRKQGLTYSEILRKVPVAKSTLSLWLRDIGLAKEQNQRLTEKKLKSIQRGGDTKHEERMKRTEKIKNKARKEINKLSKRELWLIGIALYWAEGSKEKLSNKGSKAVMVQFSNTDSGMINVYLKWVKDFLDADMENICFCIHIHKNKENDIEKVKKFWSQKTNLPISKFDNVLYKKHNPKTNRKNTGDNYYGTLRVTLRKSADLNRRIFGWVEGIVESLH